MPCFLTNDHGAIIHLTGDKNTLCYAILSPLCNWIRVHGALPILYSINRGTMPSCTAFPKYIRTILLHNTLNLAQHNVLVSPVLFDAFNNVLVNMLNYIPWFGICNSTLNFYIVHICFFKSVQRLYTNLYNVPTTVFSQCKMNVVGTICRVVYVVLLTSHRQYFPCKFFLWNSAGDDNTTSI